MVEARQRSSPWIGRVLQDKWHIDAEIGRGGVASVFRATHRQGQVAAIKIIHAELAKNEEVRKRFLREGYAANKVGHPGVVRVLDDDVDKGSAYIVMELLGQGELLEDRRMRLGGKLPVPQVVDVGIQMLDVLAAAHDKGIIHRDIKPENIFILADGTVKVLDFGIAHIKEAVSQHEATATGLLLGTPEYMAPEQALGKRGQIDAQTDIFALGATLFTLLSGESVHPCDTLTALLVAAASRQPRSLGSVKFKELPRAVIVVIDKALALEKPRRWTSARAMQEALRAAVPAPERMRDATAVPVPVAVPVSTAVTVPGAPRPKLPMPAPPPRPVRPSTVPSAMPAMLATPAIPRPPALPSIAAPPLVPAARPEPPSVPPPSAPTAVLAGRAVAVPAAPLPRSDPWTAEDAELDVDGPTVALKGGPPLPEPPALPAPPGSSRERILVAQRSTAKLDPIAWPGAVPVRPPPPARATGSSPSFPPPPPFAPAHPHSVHPASNPSWIPPAPFAPQHLAPPLPSSPRSTQPQPIALIAIALGVFVLFASSIGSCLWFRAH